MLIDLFMKTLQHVVQAPSLDQRALKSYMMQCLDNRGRLSYLQLDY